MVKYGRMQKEFPSWLLCGSHGASLDYILLGVQSSAGLRIFLRSSYLVDNEDNDSLL